jgi:multiple sugar transport system permease protein
MLYRSPRWRQGIQEIARHGVLLPFLAFALFPFYFMLVTSLKKESELYDLGMNPFLIQHGVDGSHYAYLFKQTPMLQWMINSVTVCLVATSVSLVISILAAYSLARLRFRGASSFGTAIFITYLVPTALLFIPLSRVIKAIGLSDSLWALIVTYPTFLIPFSTWLLLGYFRTVPREIEECALVDGATRVQALIRIVLPVAIPGIICTVLFSFTQSWNEFIYALTFLSSTAVKTTTVGITGELIRGDIFYWGELMAGAIVDYYVSGLTAGSTKG